MYGVLPVGVYGQKLGKKKNPYIEFSVEEVKGLNV